MDLKRWARRMGWDVDGGQNRRSWTLLLCVLVAVLMSYSWLFRSGTVPNERSRVYLAVSMIDHQTVSLEPTVDRFGGSFDIARYQGAYRSDKAPGGSLLGAALYGAVRLVSSADSWSFTELVDLMRYFLMIPIGLAGFLILRRWLRGLGFRGPPVDIVSLGWILGTSAFHYSCAFFGHQIAGVGLLGAVAAVWFGKQRAERTYYRAARGLAALGGACAGLAGMTEYPAGIPCLMIALYVLFVFWSRDRWSILAFALGALPFLAGLLVYHQLAFGGALELPYYHLVNERFSDVHTSGWMGLKMPRWEWFYGAFFSLHRGLLATSPMFVLIIPGGWALWRSGRRPLTILLAGLGLFYTFFISAWPLWEGGWAFGPRHLVASMGLMAVPIAYGVRTLQTSPIGDGLARGLVVIGMLYHQIVNAFYPELPPGIENPLMEAVALMVEHDWVAPNLVQGHTSLEGLTTLIPLALLVLIALAVVVGRGWRGYEGTKARTAAIAVVLVVVVVAGWYVQSVGPQWNGGDGFKDLIQVSYDKESRVAPPGDDLFIP